MSNELERLKEAPEKAVLFLDFDGTMSEIVDVPADARPVEGVPSLLDDLARIYLGVVVVSGRSAGELVSWLGPALDIWGVHGAERSRPGATNVELSSHVSPYFDLMSTVCLEAERELAELALDGALVEDKGIMVVLHYRAARELERAERALDRVAEDLADRHGLWRGDGKMAFELRPPVALSKGFVVAEVASDLDPAAALFAGDDVVDLPAFDALDRLREQGVHTVRVAVASAEAPEELLRRADVTVAGPKGAVEFLRSLV